MENQEVIKELERLFHQNQWELIDMESNSCVYEFVKMNISLKCFVVLEEEKSKVCHVLNHDVAISRQFNTNMPNDIWNIQKSMDLFGNPSFHDKQLKRVGRDYQPKWYRERKRKCQKCGAKAIETVEYCQSCINEIKNSLLGK